MVPPASDTWLIDRPPRGRVTHGVQAVSGVALAQLSWLKQEACQHAWRRVGLQSRVRPPARRECGMVKIRSATLGIPLGWPPAIGAIEQAGRGLAAAVADFEAAGWTVQTTRLALPPPPIF